MKHSFVFIGFLICVVFQSTSQDLSSYALKAHYPFTSDYSEASSIYSDATVRNASFGEGGIFSNGIYIGDDTLGTVITTPEITDLDDENFAIQLTFRASKINDLILVAGSSYRWLVLQSDNAGNLEVRVSKVDNFDFILTSDSKVELNEWETATVIYDESTLELSLYHNGSEVASMTLNASLKTEGNLNFTNTHGGYGRAFHGYWKNLKLYNNVSTGVAEFTAYRDLVVSPNPVKGEVFVSGFSIADSKFFLFDVSGKEVLAGEFEKNVNKIELTQSSGLYFLVIQDKTRRSVVSLQLDN